jgi:hypothetical protein
VSNKVVFFHSQRVRGQSFPPWDNPRCVFDRCSTLDFDGRKTPKNADLLLTHRTKTGHAPNRSRTKVISANRAKPKAEGLGMVFSRRSCAENRARGGGENAPTVQPGCTGISEPVE